MANSSSAVSQQFANVEWDICNPSTSRVKKIFIAMAIIATLSLLIIVPFQGFAAYFHNSMALCTLGALVSGAIYGGCKWRDHKEKERLKLAWESYKQGEEDYYSRSQASARMQSLHVWSLKSGEGKNQKTYSIEVIKGADKIRIVNKK